MNVVWKLYFWVLFRALPSLCSEVTQLGNGTFHSHLEANPLALVAFCVSWYEPCQKLYPELDAAAAVLSPRLISVVSVNCTAEVKLCGSYNVTSYPALRVFRRPDNVTRYRGKRRANSIISYMLKQIPPVLSTITKDNLEKLRSIDFPLAVAFIEEDDQESRDIVALIAEAYQDQLLFGISSDIALAKAGSVKPPFIILHSHSDHIDRVFGEKFDVENLKGFLNDISTPLIGKFSIESYYAYTQSQLPIMHIFATTEQERQSLAEALRHIAEKYRGKMNFATIDAAQYGFFAEALGLKSGHFPALVIEDVVSGETKPYDQREEIIAGMVWEFVKAYFNARSAAKNDNHDEL